MRMLTTLIAGVIAVLAITHSPRHSAEPLGYQAKPSCRLTGDSIAVMVASTKVLPCNSAGSVKGAMDTRWILNHTRPSTISVFSAASNDIKDWRRSSGDKRQQLANTERTIANLELMRRLSGAQKVIWIAPVLREPRAAVLAVAAKHGDQVAHFVASKDGVHPRNPKALAQQVRAMIAQ